MSAFVPAFAHAVGEDATARIEDAANPDRIDHVWITAHTGGATPLTISINTLSLCSREAGFDPRVRLGFLRDTWSTLPAPTLESSEGLSYADIEAEANVYYEPYERVALEALLLDFTHRALRIEVWGTTYLQHHRLGLHQIHSRRASSAVPRDIVGLDGALRFYFLTGQESVWLLFKFCGQI